MFKPTLTGKVEEMVESKLAPLPTLDSKTSLTVFSDITKQSVILIS